MEPYRLDAEMAFRRRILGRLRVVGFLIAVLLAANCLFWLRLKTGILVVTSKNPQTHEVICVHDLSPSNPFWGASCNFLFPFQRYHLYRCEYSNYGMAEFVSAQTYDDRGYKADRPKIEWHSDTSATVAFGATPDFICKQGWWSKAP